jgi:CPA2 family monovalent cation:H+ antiporter-2
MIFALVLLPAVAGALGGDDSGTMTGEPGPFAFLAPHTLGGGLALATAKLAAFVAVMMVVGRRVIPWVLHYVAHTGSRELFRLAVLAIALGVAFGASELFDVSFALGAFFAGMILAESQLSQRAAQETLPLRDAFAVLFFVSVGMLFDPMVILRQPLFVGATFLIIVVGNAVAALTLALAFRYSLQMALTLAGSLSQIGEFSFILADLGVGLKLLPDVGRDLILAGAILSIVVNPVLFAVLDRLTPWLEARERATDAEEAAPQSPEPTTTSLSGHAVLVGHGRVGGLVAEALERARQPYLVIEEQQAIVVRLQARGIEAITGNAAQPGLLEAANVAAARWLISAVPNPFESGNLIEQARAANKSLDIVARAHSDAEVEYLRNCGANRIIMGEREIARAICEHVLSGIGATTAPAATNGESALETAAPKPMDNQGRAGESGSQ